jgi:hypothetical protein
MPYSRRSYARHRDRRNLIRSRQRGDSDENLVVITDEFASVYWAVLVIYRQSGTDTPIHGIADQVWKGQEKFAAIPPVHCAGMVATQVHTYSLPSQRIGRGTKEKMCFKVFDI